MNKHKTSCIFGTEIILLHAYREQRVKHVNFCVIQSKFIMSRYKSLQMYELSVASKITFLHITFVTHITSKKLLSLVKTYMLG